MDSNTTTCTYYGSGVRLHGQTNGYAKGKLAVPRWFLHVKVQSEALAESSIVIGRVFGQQSG